uniref:DUF7352 domain-containing protein n=1 Tax=viral metagenome TaxID=1070528 RepID=A0A6H2A2W0_9ZZZZ
MRTIYKYQCLEMDNFTIEMPTGSHILTVQMQRGEPCIWAIVDPDAFPEQRHFQLFGTGHPIDGIGRYIGTFQLMGGNLVFHLFEV